MRSRLVLWGAYGRDVQVGSREDRDAQPPWPGFARFDAVRAGRTVAEMEAAFRQIGQAGMSMQQAADQMRANLDRMSVRVGER